MKHLPYSSSKMREIYSSSFLALSFLLLMNFNSKIEPCTVKYLDNVCPESVCTFESMLQGDTTLASAVESEILCSILDTFKDTFRYKDDIWEEYIFDYRILKLGTLNHHSQMHNIFALEVNIGPSAVISLIAIIDGEKSKVLKRINLYQNYNRISERSSLLEDNTPVYELDKKNQSLSVYKFIKNGTYIGGMDTIVVDLVVNL